MLEKLTAKNVAIEVHQPEKPMPGGRVLIAAGGHGDLSLKMVKKYQKVVKGGGLYLKVVD